MTPSLPSLSHHERAALQRAARQVAQACERPWIAALNQAKAQWECRECGGVFSCAADSAPVACPFCQGGMLIKITGTGMA